MILYATRSTLPSPPISRPATPSLAIVSAALTSASVSPATFVSQGSVALTSSSTTAFVLASSLRGRTSKHAETKTGPSVTVNPLRSASASPADSDVNMVKRKERRDASCDSSLSTASMPTPARDVSMMISRPPTPVSPVQIPRQGNHSRRHNLVHPLRRHNSHGCHGCHGCHVSHRRKIPHTHSPDALSPSMAALLAVTDIPRPRPSQRKARKADKPLMGSGETTPHYRAHEMEDERQLSERDIPEKDPSLASSPVSPMDVLLSPPESLLEDDDGFGCSMTRTLSIDSMPSLGDSLATDAMSCIDSPRSQSPAPGVRRRMMSPSPMRKLLEPIRSPPDSIDEHPLAASHDADDIDFVTVDKPDLDEDEDEALAAFSSPFKPLRAAFKSNLTASLRALRSAARSISNINLPSIPPDDFVTRSLLTVDPGVPFTDERRPPVTEEMPSAELRRYLNPTTRLSLETQPGSLQKPKFSASIQMQTYRIQRSRLTSSSRGSLPAMPKMLSSDQSTEPSSSSSSSSSSDDASSPPLPAMRQREMRENPDFIRIAVMEMAMRRRGKLDSSKPGRARWALPPRKTSMKLYEIGADGVPERWIPITC